MLQLSAAPSPSAQSCSCHLPQVMFPRALPNDPMAQHLRVLSPGTPTYGTYQDHKELFISTNYRE